MRNEDRQSQGLLCPHSSFLIPESSSPRISRSQKRLHVGVRASNSMAFKIAFALEELLAAAGVPHRVERTDRPEGWDLFYGAEPPRGGALWMAASPKAARFYQQPGVRIERVETRRAAGVWVRLPAWEGRSAAVCGEPVPTDGVDPAAAAALPDLAAAAFFFLSRWEERQAGCSCGGERDMFGRFPLAASVFGRGLWSLTECPVEVYARALRRALEATPRTAWVADLPRRDGSDGASGPVFTVALSHDIDTVRRWDARGFARTGREAARYLARGRVPSAARAFRSLAAGLRDRLRDRDPHQNLAAILQLEERAEAKSTFFLLARQSHRWDGTHPHHYQRLLPSFCQVLAPAAEVGVHASTGATSAAALQAERERLATLAGAAARGVRFHNLRGGSAMLPLIAAAGFEYDTTLGFAEEPGFRAGIARPFRAYDLDRDGPLDLIEVPLVLMDTTLLSSRYLGLPVDRGRRRALAALAPLRRWGGAAALLWHNDNLPPNPAGGYAALYSELIEWTRAAGGRVAPLAEIVDEWKHARAALQGARDEG